MLLIYIIYAMLAVCKILVISVSIINSYLLNVKGLLIQQYIIWFMDNMESKKAISSGTAPRTCLEETIIFKNLKNAFYRINHFIVLKFEKIWVDGNTGISI